MRKSNWVSTGAVVTMLTIGVVSMSPLQTTIASSADMPMPMTAADNEAYAVKLEKEAVDLEAKAKEHAADVANYRSRKGGKQESAYATIANHCEKLAKYYSDAAIETHAMAASHRALAKEG